MNHYKQILIASTLAALFIASVGVAAAEPVKLTVHVDRPGIVISPMLYGLMTEEISHSYDGGLYAELIRNRSFQDNSAIPEHWTLIQKDGGAGEIALDTSMPLNASIRTSLKLTATTASPTRQVGVANDGWWGIPVKPRTTYKSSFYAKANSSDHGPLTIAIENADGTHVFAKARVNGITGMWQKYTTTLTTGEVAPSTSNRFVIYTDAPGTVWLSVVSLFPPTYHNRVNGNRIDLMERLAAMKPAFLRFPGGNYMEGNTISERFEWKDTIGDISARVGHQSSWGYPSSNGMGLLEFLTWCEDLHISPILAVFAGYSLQGEHIVPGHALEPYVQDALDEIEYVTGDSNTKWGARRIADGHPKPFALEYVEVGNEDFFDRSKSYDGRFAQFRDALKARYPSIKLIATMPVTSRIPDMIDDHFYRPATAMEADADHYAHDDRKGPQVFVGEWASILPDISPWSKEALSISPTPNFGEALGDAAWMIGMERSSDIIKMHAYAPLFVNVSTGARSQANNLIGYDAMTSYGSPSYWAQVMFSNNRGDVELPVDMSSGMAPVDTPHGSVGVGTWATQAEFKDVKVTHGDSVLYEGNLSNADGDWTITHGDWKVSGHVLSQKSVDTGCYTTVGTPMSTPAWTDYSYTLKARKTGGEEGFQILFHARDKDDFIWWNIGGWGNTRTQLQRLDHGQTSDFGPTSPVTVETGRWYDIRVDVSGSSIRCYLDGQLIASSTDTAPPAPKPLYAAASRDKATGDVILKIDNVAATPQYIAINLQGVSTVEPKISGQIMAGKPDDENSIAEPENIAPHSISIAGGRQFTYDCPAYSVTVLREKTK